MAISFDEVNDYISVADIAGLTFPTSDWVIGFWTKVDDNTGTLYQYLFSTGNIGALGSLNIYLNEASEANPNDWAFRYVDDDGTTTGDISTVSAPGADGKWRLIVVQRRTADTEFQMWFCEPFATATKESSTAATASFAAANGVSWNIGRRNDGQASRFYGSLACEHFCGDFSLSQSQIELLGKGISPLSLAQALGQALKIYLPMWDATAEAVADLSHSGNNGTLNGTPVKAGSHAPVMLMTTRWPTLSTVLAVVETISVGGIITPTGVLVKQPSNILNGSVTFAGTLVKQSNSIFSGSIASTGALVEQVQKALSGAITPTGSLLNNAIRALSLSGSITPVGSLIKQAQVVFAGSVLSVGDLTKQVNKVLAGSVTPAGTLANLKVAVLNVAGTIIPTGSLVKRVNKIVSGMAGLAGVLIEQVQHNLVGAITPIGSLIKQVQKVLSGSITPIGALTNVRVAIISLAGSVTLAGSLVKQVNKIVANAIGPTGSLIKSVSRTLSGTVSSVGALFKTGVRSFTGSIGLAGVLVTVEVSGGAAVVALKTLTLQARSLGLSLLSRTLNSTLKSRALNFTLKDSRD